MKQKQASLWLEEPHFVQNMVVILDGQLTRTVGKFAGKAIANAGARDQGGHAFLAQG
ncbi:hypothetical protein P3T23_008534 [Paraburkholderia sp. GAS448]|uniref:hypothetical protein n=1 Tax=Paraburkholderia sp. GAS448 TaxID=3035136 RepID=UPI003D220883